MSRQAGITLIEATVASLILVAGLAGVGGCFSYAVRSSIRIRQQTTALALLSTKMEELKSDSDLKPGRYSQFITNSGTFLLTWEISSEVPKRVTVIVSQRATGSSEAFEELSAISTLIGPGF